MKPRLAQNIDRRGRFLRGAMALGCFVAAGFCFSTSIWLAAALAVAGAFGLFEALRGWCALRACGIKTRF